MDKVANIALREVEPSDLGIFYVQQVDPEALWLAAFVSKDPSNKEAYDAHWAKILKSTEITKRTILADGQIAGHVSVYPHGERLEVTYWLGKEYWGRGIATRALSELLRIVPGRPIFGRAATDNVGSIRVLQKCGFKIIGNDKGFAHGRGKETEECILRLDGGQAV